MSIYGPEDPDVAAPGGLPADVATKTYVNTQDNALRAYVDTHVEKAGDTMTGNLNMGGKLVVGLPTTTPETYRGDEAVSWAQTVGLVIDAANTLVKKAGDTMTGNLINQATTLNHLGIVISTLGNIAVHTSGGGPDIDIRQTYTNTENSLPGGIRLRNPPDEEHFQLGWSDAGSLALYHTTRSNPVISVVGEFTPTHLTGLADPVNQKDAATKAYVDSRKPMITIWAEENGALEAGEYEWSFGNGAVGSKHGYPMMVSGRILRLGLSSVDAQGVPGGVLVVSVVLNGQDTSRSVTKAQGSQTGVAILTPPLEVSAGSVINFLTHSTIPGSASTVSALIELDL